MLERFAADGSAIRSRIVTMFDAPMCVLWVSRTWRMPLTSGDRWSG
jgi:hypothetical protein